VATLRVSGNVIFATPKREADMGTIEQIALKLS
jgi:hypothetical protein